MAGKNQERDDVRAASGDKATAQGHTEAMHHEVFKYDPKTLNHRTYGADASHGACITGPKLNDLTIDTSIHEQDTVRRGDSYQQRKETLKHEMPISNEHFRELAQKGAQGVSEGTFNLQMRNALDEAYKSDGGPNAKSGKHVEDLLKYVNSQACNSEYTVARDGNHIKMISTSQENKKPTVDLYNLDDKDWQANHWKHTGKNKDKI